MKKESIIIAIESLDEAIQVKIQEIFNLNHKAQNFKKLSDEKYEEMARVFKNLLPCKNRVFALYESLEHLKLFHKLEAILISMENREEKDDK